MLRYLKYFVALIAFFAFVSCQKDQPNILFILADDLGYADVSYIGTKKGISTPHIDALAVESMLFTNAYAASPVCSPTRASIMTGKYPSSLKLTCHIPGMGMEKYLHQRSKGKLLMEANFIDRLPLDEVTIAEVLKKNGYRTGFFGKWHLAGEGSQTTLDGNVDPHYHPDNHGFDVNIGGNAYGQPASYFSPYKHGTIEDGPKGEYLTERLTTEAISYMKEKRDSPFFCFLSYYSIHTPYQVPMEYVDKNDGNKYNAMVNALDDNVGRLMRFMVSQGLDENTVVIFYSDNGGLYSNKPLNGRKGSLLEGGIRVPMMVKYPPLIPANSHNETPVTSPDIFPTLLDFAGIPLNGYKERVEGLSLFPLLTQKAETLPERALYWHFPHHRNVPGAMACAIRQGDWKLIYEFENKKVALYNLHTDPYEKFNLANTEKDKAEELLNKLKHWQEITDVEMPETNPNF